MKNTTPAVAQGVACLLIGINLVFLVKYLDRVTDWSVALALAVVGVQALGLLPQGRKLLRRLPLRWLAGVYFAGLMALVVAVHLKVPLEGLNVDRWSVISSFWEALAAGEYPYFARSHMGNPPGPMPVYFLLAYPFYVVGWLEFLAALGAGGLAWWLVFRRPDTAEGRLAFWLLITSVWVAWEVVVRSNVLTYSTLVLAGLVWWRQTFTEQRAGLAGISIVTGLLLATRSVFALVYLLVFGEQLWDGKRMVWRVIGAGTLALLTFAATFLPLWLGWGDDFWEMNPFLVQSGFLVPPVLVGIFFLVALALLFYPGLKGRVFLLSGVLLVGVVAVYAAYHVIRIGFAPAFFGSKVDLSYFLFGVPLLIYGLVVELPLREMPTKCAT